LAGNSSLSAQSLALAGILGNKALLVVDGGAPKAVAMGETHQGVRVLSTNASQTVVELSGQRLTLTVGDTPLRLNGKTNNNTKGTRIVLSASSGGHFFTTGSANGSSARFLIDTGASVVAMSRLQADRAGIDFKLGQPVQMNTANGVTSGWLIKLDSVRVGDIEIFGVDAVVTPQPMPFMLLGNSFLSRVQMMRDGDTLTLTKRY
jgi:aspartyl protease family protein